MLGLSGIYSFKKKRFQMLQVPPDHLGSSNSYTNEDRKYGTPNINKYEMKLLVS